MARPYSEKFLIELRENTSDNIGVRLGRLCVKANLPATHVATVLETTKTTVYSWFRGQGVREGKRRLVETLMQSLQEDLDKEVLPAKNLIESKRYLQELSGLPI